MTTMLFDSGDKVGMEVEVTPVGPDLYRIDEITLCLFGADDDADDAWKTLPIYGDIVHATPAQSGHLTLVRVHERGGYQQETLFLPDPCPEALLDRLFSLVASQDGIAAVDMGGLFTFAVPAHQRNALVDALEKALRES